MRGLNKCQFIGNLGNDPEVKYTANGTPVSTFSIAVNETYTDKNGEKQETTEWVRIVMWSKLAELAGEYLHKGNPLYVEGRFKTRSWEKEDGTTGYVTEVHATNMIMLGTKPSVPTPGDNDRSTSGAQQSDHTEITDDDIPF